MISSNGAEEVRCCNGARSTQLALLCFKQLQFLYPFSFVTRKVYPEQVGTLDWNLGASFHCGVVSGLHHDASMVTEAEDCLLSFLVRSGVHPA